MDQHVFYRSNTPYPLALRADGPYIWDSSGKQYLDGCSGALVTNIGQGRSEVGQAMAQQACQLAFVHGSQFSSEVLEEYARRLSAFCGLPDYRFWAVSGGSEATESAIKLARQYQVECGQAGRYKIVSRLPSYHGASLGSLAASGMGARRELYTPLMSAAAWPKMPKPDPNLSGQDDAERLRAVLEAEGPETVAAFMAEPVVGASDAALSPNDGYYQRIRQICDEYGLLLIADEVMCGMGRCAAPLALSWWNTQADITVLGKGLAAGYAPLAGLLASPHIYNTVMHSGSGAFKHGFTYAGHPISVAAGRSVLEIVEREQLTVRAGELGEQLLSGLADLQNRFPQLLTVRGLGLMLGVVLGDPATNRSYAHLGLAAQLGKAALEHGLIIYPGSGAEDGLRGDHLLIGPPLSLTNQQADELLAKLQLTFEQVLEHLS